MRETRETREEGGDVPRAEANIFGIDGGERNDTGILRDFRSPLASFSSSD